MKIIIVCIVIFNFSGLVNAETKSFHKTITNEHLSGSMGAFHLSKRKNPVRDFSFQNKVGHTLNISEFRGKIVILNIWATWCLPCRKEMPSLNNLQKIFGDKKFVVLAISQDKAGIRLIEKFYSEMKITHLEIFIDRRGKSQRLSGVFVLPTTLIIDPDGFEIGRLIGGAVWDSKESIRLIKFLLEGVSN
jgi:thiol-disulfide isomerase/thioredoxin